MDAVSVLINTKRRLQEKGWGQGRLGPAQGPNCILGAFQHEAWCQPAFGKAVRLFSEEAGCEGFVADWNDRPMRTKEEVLDAFDRAIDKAILLSRPATVDG